MFDTNDNLIAYDLYAYCNNNIINKVDSSGEAYLNYVAFGFQIELAYSNISVGIEFIFTLNLRKFYAFAYGGATLKNIKSGKISTILRSTVYDVFQKPSSLLKFAKGFNLSIGVFMVYRKWSKSFSASKYAGSSKSAGVAVKVYPGINVRPFTAWSSSYWVIGLGICTSAGHFSYTTSYYKDITSNVRSLINSIKGNVNKIKSSLSLI